MSKAPKSKTRTRQESDIIISADGTIAVSFLWNDLAEVIAPSLAPKQSLQSFKFKFAAEPSTFPIDDYRKCHLCPKRCGFDRSSKAHKTCGDFQLRVATSGLSMGDEPSIRGKRGSGVIMLSGCPLRCPSCHNPEMVASGEPYSIDDFLGLAQNLVKEGAENLQILSPTVHFPALRIIFQQLKQNGLPIPIVLKSSGYESIEQLQLLNGLVDIYLPDLKFGQCSIWARQAGVPNYFEVARNTVTEMFQQVGPLQIDERGVAQRGLLVRHVRAPLPPPEVKQILDFLSKLPTESVSLLSHFSDLTPI